MISSQYALYTMLTDIIERNPLTEVQLMEMWKLAGDDDDFDDDDDNDKDDDLEEE